MHMKLQKLILQISGDDVSTPKVTSENKPAAPNHYKNIESKLRCQFGLKAKDSTIWRGYENMPIDR